MVSNLIPPLPLSPTQPFRKEIISLNNVIHINVIHLSEGSADLHCAPQEEKKFYQK